MSLFKNIGIFGEAEERHDKMVKKMVAQSALMKLLDGIADYPDPDNAMEQILFEEMIKIALEQFEEIENNEIINAE